MARAKALLNALEALQSALPSMQERAAASDALKELIDYLRDVREQLLTLPTAEDVVSVGASIAQLKIILARAEESPLLSLALGLEARPKARQRRAVERTATDISAHLQHFSELTIDQLRDELCNEDLYSIAQLNSIARGLGTRVNARKGRDALANQLVTKIANLRGYQALSETRPASFAVETTNPEAEP